MSLAQLSWMRLTRRVVAIIARWHDWIGTVSNPYRPELHYMRGPGPKWHAKHRRRNFANV
jgi:hypothetical protein